jgi:hypothetical protein
MIIINESGSTSTVILELLQSASGQTPIYLFELVKKGTSLVKSFIATDVSPVPCRYQKFLIENINGDNLDGQIYLVGGEYDWAIWQVDSISLSANKLVKLQTGLAFVKGLTNSIYA